MAEHKKQKHSKKYEAGVEILTTIFKDQLTITNNDKVYSATKFHAIDNYLGIYSYQEMFKLFENINLLIKDSRGYVFNDKLVFRKVGSLSIPEFNENIKIKIELLVTVALSYIEIGNGVNCSEAKRVKHIIERMDFVSANKITKTIGGVACYYDRHSIQGNILSKLLLFSALETPCSIKANINGSILEFHDVKVKEIIIDDEDIKVITSAIPLPISSFSDIKKIYNYNNEQDLKEDLRITIAICSENEELNNLFKILSDL